MWTYSSLPKLQAAINVDLPCKSFVSRNDGLNGTKQKINS